VRKSLIAATVVLFGLGFAQVTKAGSETQTLPQYNGTGSYTDPGPYQPTTVVGTFDILSGDTSLVISGTFGNSTISSSAGVDLYLGSILVATCVEFASCWDSGAPWSDTLTSTEIGDLGTGIVDFSATQTSEYTIRLGDTTLVQGTPVTTPEPSSLLLLGSSLLMAAGMMKRKIHS